MGTIRYALLGLLVERASYPYELTQRFHARVGPAWNLSSSAMSQHVRRLEQEGLVERVRPNHRTPGNNESWIYRITDEGRALYVRWVTTSSEEAPEPVRDALFIKIGLCKPQDAPYVLEAINRRLQLRTQQLATYQHQIDQIGSRNGFEQKTSTVPLKATIERLKADVAWLQEARVEIESCLSPERR